MSAVTLEKARKLCAEWPLISRFRKWGGIKDLEAFMGFHNYNLLDERSAPCPKEFGNSVPVTLKGAKLVGERESAPAHKWGGGCLGKGAHHVSGHFHVAEVLGGMGVHSGSWLVARKAEAKGGGRGGGERGRGPSLKPPKWQLGER